MKTKGADSTPCEDCSTDLDEDVAVLAGEEAEAGKERDPQGGKCTVNLGESRVVDRFAEMADGCLRKLMQEWEGRSFRQS
eukprot:evm.model.NODE_48856_length_45577_cov_40.689011.3